MNPYIMNRWFSIVSPQFQDCFKELNQLGTHGQYGATFKCIHKKTLETYVVKQINKNIFYRIPKKYRSRYLHAMHDELDILTTFSHPNIIKIENIYEDKIFMYIVMEECTGGNLYERIIEKGQWTEQDVAKLIKQILTALKYMHEQNQIVHCNLKPENILFADKSNDSKLKIVDFGFSKVLPRLKHLTDFQSTPYYTAPETIKDKKYNYYCDIWSVGVIMYVLLFGYPPFYVDPVKYGKHERKHLFSKIQRGFIPKIRSTEKHGFGPWFPDHLKVSAEARDLIRQLLTFKVKLRCTAREGLQHPWIVNNTVSVSLNMIDSLTTFVNTCEHKLIVIKIFRERFREMRLRHLMELEYVFKVIDTDKDGIISIKQFKDAMPNIQNILVHSICINYWYRLNALNHVKFNLDFLCNLVDEYIYGKQMSFKNVFKSLHIGNTIMGINYIDLLTVLVRNYLYCCDQILYDSFRKLDDDDDGKITINELKTKLKEYDPLSEYDRGVKIIDEHALDLGGVIKYEEFLLYLHPDFEELHWVPQVFKKMTSIFPQKRRKNLTK